MNRRSYLFGTAALVIAAISVVVFAKGPGNNNGQKGPKQAEETTQCPKISQASLNLDTQGCPTGLGDVATEARTHWDLEKSAISDPLVNPENSPVLYEVKVTEGPTDDVLSASGQIVVTNSGQQTPTLANVVVNLQDNHGKPFTVATATAEQAAACHDGTGLEGAETCYGSFQPSAGATLTLTDSFGNDVTALLSDVPIPPTEDYDDDGDGLTGEDCVELDGEQIDNDGDGLLNEDCLDICPNAVVLNYTAEFDMGSTGLEPGDSARIEVLTTFAGAGGRGNSPNTTSCTADVNCDGSIGADNPDTCEINESEEDNVRTVQQRDGFTIPDFTEVCSTVNKSDSGAYSEDASCVDVTTNGLSDSYSTEGEGTEHLEEVSGTASCTNGTCETELVNTVVLSCADGRDEFVEGSPAGASIPATCEEEEPPPGTDEYCTQTQGGWGTDACHGHNTACLLQQNFDSIFPSGVNVGDTDGFDADSFYAMLFESAADIAAYLPAGSTPGTLTANLLNPASSSAGVFGGQLTAATLNVAFSNAGVGKCTLTGTCTSTPKPLGDLVYKNGCVAGPLVGASVEQVLGWSHCAISGESLASCGVPGGVSLSDLSDALAALNENYDDCNDNAGGSCLEESQ